MKKLIIMIAASLVAAAIAPAQKVELGGTIGGGWIRGRGRVPRAPISSRAREVCALFAGRFALFGEYTHWEVTGAKKSTQIERVDLGGVGLRIQGGKRVRPFFDVGFAFGQDQFTHTIYPSGTGLDSHSIAGIVLAGGRRDPGGQPVLRPPAVALLCARPQPRTQGWLPGPALASVFEDLARGGLRAAGRASW